MDTLTIGKLTSRQFCSWWQLGIFVVILTSMVGCDLFSNNKNKELLEEINAPIANFVISVTSGKAPLTVDFSDTSASGSSPINGWQWDFGDGGTSNEQDPQYIYLNAGTYDVELIVSSSDGSDATTRSGVITVEPSDKLVTITLVDADGLPVQQAQASSDSFVFVSQSYNEINQLEISLRPNEQQGIIRISKQGYADALVYLENSLYSQTHTSTMIKRAPPLQFDGFVGAELVGIDGASVEIPGEALIRPDGTIATGVIDAYITPVNISDPKQINAFPGSFYGLPKSEEIPDGEDPQQQLFSYGVVEYSFFENGVELQLKEGAEASLELPIYANSNIFDESLIEGGLVPMWTLNESSGIWEQQAEGIIIVNPSSPSGFSLKTSTTHFSWFNTDAWAGSNNGSGNGPRNPINCFITVNISGLQDGEVFEFTLQNLALTGPVSSLSTFLTYDGTAIASRVPTGALISATVRRGHQLVSKAILCVASQATIEIELAEVKPEFIDWRLTVEPVFTREDENFPYEVSSNNLLIGGSFYGTDRVEVESSLIGAQVLTLPNDQFFAAEFGPNDSTPTLVTATLRNDIGETQQISNIDYVEEQSPTLDFLFVEKTPDSQSLKYQWKVEGADDASVYYLGEDPTSIGLVVLHIEDMESGSFVDSQLLDQTGYLRIEFSNQYGNTEIISRLSELSCIPGSENCAIPAL
jgi:PKD repeat protein